LILMNLNLYPAIFASSALKILSFITKSTVGIFVSEIVQFQSGIKPKIPVFYTFEFQTIGNQVQMTCVNFVKFNLF
jgi:hypothetical protein